MEMETWLCLQALDFLLGEAAEQGVKVLLQC